MKKFIIIKFIIVYLALFCISLVHAQVPPALPVTSLPTATPQPPPIASPNGQTTPPAKYAEYQSYCRQNDFDERSVFTNEQKKRRIDLIEKKIVANSTDTAAMNALIKEFIAAKDYKRAEDVFKKYSENLSAEDQIIWTSEFSVQKKLSASAISKLEKFIIENPTANRALIKLAQIKKTLQFYSEAADIYIDLQNKNKKSDYSIELCEIYTLDSHHKDAEVNCLQAAKKNPANHLPEIYLGISHRERENFKEAQLNFENSLKKQKSEFALTCLGELHFLKKERQKTIEYLNQAIELNRASYRAQLGLALAEFEDKKYDAALVNFKEACALGQKDTLEMRKSHKILEERKSPLAKNYYDEIQKCKAKELF